MLTALLGYSLEIQSTETRNRLNTIKFEYTSRGLYNITSRAWEITNLDTSQQVAVATSASITVTFTTSANYKVTLTLVDTLVGTVTEEYTFNINNLFFNYYALDFKIYTDGYQPSRGLKLPYFVQGTTPTLLVQLLNYDYEHLTEIPVDITNLVVAVKIKTLYDYETNKTYDEETDYLVTYNSADDPTIVIKDDPILGKFNVKLEADDTTQPGILVMQITLSEVEGNVIKTDIKQIECKKTI